MRINAIMNLIRQLSLHRKTIHSICHITHRSKILLGLLNPNPLSVITIFTD